MAQTHYIIRIKEWNNPRIIETEHVGNLDKRGVIEFFGLEQPDVESYTIQVAGKPEMYGHKKAIQG